MKTLISYVGTGKKNRKNSVSCAWNYQPTVSVIPIQVDPTCREKNKAFSAG
jgi:hypothetical protein